MTDPTPRARQRALLAAARALPAASLYEAAGKRGDMAPHIRALVPGRRFAGFAFTLRTLPGDNLGVFHAIAQAQADDVLVIDAGGSDRLTIWGGSSTSPAHAKGLAGCVTNAAARDLDEIAQLGFPVYAAGASVRGATRHHPGWPGVPVCVGDVTVHPGDLVAGDADGVVVIEAAQAEAVVARALERQAGLQARDARLAAGESILAVFNL